MSETAMRRGSDGGARSDRKSLLSLYVFCVALSVSCGYLVESGGLGSYRLELLIGIGATLAASFAGFIVVRLVAAEGTSLVYRLGGLLFLVAFVAFGVASLAWLGQPSGLAFAIRPEGVPSALVLASAWLLSVGFGYLIAPRSLRSISAQLGRGLVPLGEGRVVARWRWLAVWGLGVTFRLLRILTGQFNYLGDPDQALNSPSQFAQLLVAGETLSLLGAVGGVVAGVRWRSSGAAIPIAVSIVICVEAGFAMLGGMRGELLALIFGVTVAWLPLRRLNVRKRKSPLGVRLAGVGAAVAVLVAVPAIETYRDELRAGGVGESKVSESLEAAGPALQANLTPAALVESISETPTHFLNRLRYVDSLALVTQRVPSSIEMQSRLSVFTAPVAAITPRLVWQGKPVVSTAEEFTRDFYRLPAAVRSGTAITVPGDLYRRGGLASILMGGFLAGLILRILDAFCRYPEVLGHVFIYVALASTVLMFELDWVSWIAGMPLVLASGVVAGRLCSRRVSSLGMEKGAVPSV